MARPKPASLGEFEELVHGADRHTATEHEIGEQLATLQASPPEEVFARDESGDETLREVAEAICISGSLLFAGLHEFDELDDALGAYFGAALGGVNPAQVVLAIEAGQAVEEAGGIGVGGQRGRDVGRESLALRAFEFEGCADGIAEFQTVVAAVDRSERQEVAFAEFLQRAADLLPVDCAADVVAIARAPHFPRVERHYQVDAPFFGAFQGGLE